MKVHDATKNKNILLSTYTTVAPLNYMLKLVGLYRISRDRNKLTYSQQNWKFVLLLIAFFILNCYSVYIKFESFGISKFTFHDYIPIVYMCGCIQYIADLVLVYKYGRQHCLDYYASFENIDDTLGMPDYKKIKRSIVTKCIFFFFIGFLTLIADYSSWVMSYGWMIATVHSIDYIYWIIKILTALDAITHTTQLKYRLMKIEEILECYYCNIQNLPGVTKNVIHNNDWIRPVNFISHLVSKNTVSFNCPNIILNLSKCYLLLLKQCDYINCMFGFRILLGGLVYLLDMVTLMNALIRLVTGTLVTYYDPGFFPIVSLIMKIVYYISILLCAINSCEQNYKKTERIVRIVDHLLVNKRITMEVRSALKELKDLIMTRPVNFNALNFYSLDYPALLSMASAIITYTIILLQSIK